MRAAPAILAVLIVTASCGGETEQDSPQAAATATATATASATPTETPTATPTPAATQKPLGKRVEFRVPGAKPVKGFLRSEGRGAPAVVLLHQRGGGSSEWEGFAPALHEAGFTTLAYDGLDSIDEVELTPQLAAAVRFLRKRRDLRTRRIGLVGASIGASTAVRAMTTPAGRGVRAAVALSPVVSGAFFELQDNDRYRPHDVLFYSDKSEAADVTTLYEGAVRSRRVESPTPGHGVVLLEEPSVRDATVAWLRDRLR